MKITKKKKIRPVASECRPPDVVTLEGSNDTFIVINPMMYTLRDHQGAKLCPMQDERVWLVNLLTGDLIWCRQDREVTIHSSELLLG